MLDPASGGGGGCGALGQILTIIVAVVVTIYTSGAKANLFGLIGSAMFGAAAGSTASQLVGMVTGDVQNSLGILSRLRRLARG